MSRRGRGSAPAKAILLGEHFVVHGAPALALPITSLGVAVCVEELAGGGAAPGGHLRACLEVCRARLGGPPLDALRAEVEVGVPISAGLGSSAALAVAVARAWCALLGLEPSVERVRPLADACERLVHGTPSGIDAATIVGARPLRFVRGAEPAPLRVHPAAAFLLLDSGRPGRTAETVAAVAAARERDLAGFEARAARARELVAAGEAALAAGEVEALGAALDACHTLLTELGVSTPELEALVAAARAAGAAGAKLTGGGGGGCVIAACRAEELEALAASLSAAGLRPAARIEPRPQPAAGRST